MPSEPTEPVQVEYTPEFKRNLRVLAKKYRRIRSDVQPVIEQLRWRAGSALNWRRNIWRERNGTWRLEIIGSPLMLDTMWRRNKAERKHWRRYFFAA